MNTTVIWKNSVKGRTVPNLSYADDTTFLAETEEELVTMLRSVRRHSARTDVHLKLKDKDMGPIGEVFLNGEKIEIIDNFIYLASASVR